MLASLPTLDMAGLTTLFDDQLKTCLPSMSKDQAMAKLVLAGCDPLDNCFKMFSGQNKCLIAEQLEYSCQTTEQLLPLLQLGSSQFI